MSRRRAHKGRSIASFLENIRKIWEWIGLRRSAASAQMDGAGLFHAQGQQALVGMRQRPSSSASMQRKVWSAWAMSAGISACAAPGCALSATVRSQWPNSPFWKRCNAMPYSLIQTRCRRVQR